MQTFIYPTRNTWASLTERPVIETGKLEMQVRPILAEVKQSGDEAVRQFGLRFDGVHLDELAVSKEEFEVAEAALEEELKTAIQAARKNIEAFHQIQVDQPSPVETMPGVRCWRKSVPITHVGLYIPGGTAPLFSSILMLGIPAKIAGCEEIVLCTPPGKGGIVHPAILYTAQLLGISKVFKIGGAQAIAAMAYGTESVPGVYKIFGPGNQYVTMAKQLVSTEGVAIDMPAGPSEVLVVADETANPVFVAADLLSQAEHGVDSQVILVATHETMVAEVEEELARQLDHLPRRGIVEQTLKNSKNIVLEAAEIMDFVNAYAPEHLILAVGNTDAWAAKVKNAGSVFLGHYTPESVGDYASGTNHTLPTNGYARAYSGVSVDSFIKKITFQELTPEGIAGIGPTVERMAEAEDLEAHKRAVSVRLATIHATT